MHEVQHADQVDVHGVGERLRRQAGGQWADARVGDHDVEMSQLGDAAIDRGRQRRAVADIGDCRDHALPFLLDQPGGLVQIFGPRQRVLVGLDVLADVHRDDVGALSGQHPRM